MSEHDGRYADIPEQLGQLPDGRLVRCLGRRFLPPAGSHAAMGEVEVRQGDRLDLIAARALGDPDAGWRIADANAATDPEALTDEPGRCLSIPLPVR